MKKRIIRFFCGFLVVCALFTSPIFAHSGRTDSNGGHRDNKNKSGLGYYHYHHGYGPHLHPNGICPYAYSPDTTSKMIEKNESSSNVKKESKIGIVATNIKTFINGNEIPTFLYNGNPNDTVIIAEDLRNYGFDKVWNNNDRTLTVTLNKDKEVKPMAMDYYHNLKQGQYLLDIYKSDIKVYLKKSANSEAMEPIKVYFLNGYTAISTDELKNFGTLSWDSDTRKISIIIE